MGIASKFGIGDKDVSERVNKVENRRGRVFGWYVKPGECGIFETPNLFCDKWSGDFSALDSLAAICFGTNCRFWQFVPESCCVGVAAFDP